MRALGASTIPVGQPCQITIDGRVIPALSGETVGAALVASDVRETRTTLSGTPRGLFCGMGTCQECLVTIDGVRARACMTSVADGMRVETGAPSIDNGSTTKQEPGAAVETRSCDVLVVGAGPAGLAASRVAANAGAHVILLDERPAAGGQFFKSLAASHQFRDGAADAQYRAGGRLVDLVRASGTTLVSGALVWTAEETSEGIEAAARIEGRTQLFRAKRLILATGGYERPHPVPGWTLPGVMTTGALQTLVRAYRVVPKGALVIAGNGPLNLQVASEIVSAGGQLAGLFEAAPRPGLRYLPALLAAISTSPGLLADAARYRAKLARASVPVRYCHIVTRIEGRDTIEAAIVAPVDAHGRVDDAKSKRIAADLVALGYGFLPNDEIARQLGAKSGEGRVLRDSDCRTSVASVFLAGDNAGLGGARLALADGESAGRAVARDLGLPVQQASRQLARAESDRRFQKSLWTIYAAPEASVNIITTDTLVCRCEEVTRGAVDSAIKAGAETVASIKSATRAGMGPCQGRYCVGTLGRLLTEAKNGRPIPDTPVSAPKARPPHKPIPVGAVACEKPEWVHHARLDPPEAAGALSGEPLPADLAEADIAIIGGGVIGHTLAYFLATRGEDALVVEAGGGFEAASGTNAGSLHVQLQSHLARYDQARRADVLALLPLSQAAAKSWKSLALDSGFGIGLRRAGGLMLAETEQELSLLEEKVRIEQGFGIDVELLPAEAIRSRYPYISRSVIGGAFCREEGFLNPLLGNRMLVRAMKNGGARRALHARVRGIEQRDGAFRVETTRGPIRAGRVVNCAGPWAGVIAGMMGHHLPVHATVLHMNVTEACQHAIDPLIEHAGRHLTMKQVQSGNVIIGGGWPGRLSDRTGRDAVLRSSIEGNLFVAQSLVPGVAKLSLIRTWTGITTMIEDDLPFVGPVPGVPGAYACVSHTGYTLGPVCAQLLAEFMTGQQPALDMRPFALDRP